MTEWTELTGYIRHTECGCYRAAGVPTVRGFVLLVVLVTISMCALIAAGLMFRVQAESNSASAISARQQALMAALSGIRRAVNVIEQNSSDPFVWRDNPDVFFDQPLWHDGSVQWSFTVYAPDETFPDGLRYGVADEAEKININIADESTLSATGILSDEQIDCLLDYIDADENLRRLGSEQEQYDRLPIPYRVANAPLMSTEQAMMVTGLDALAVYGEDANLNGVLDANEDDGDERFPQDNSDGVLEPSLCSLTTAFSKEYYLSDKEFNINDYDSLVTSPLSKNTLELIDAYHADGNRFYHPAELLNMTYSSVANQGTSFVSDITENNIDDLHDLLQNYYAGVYNPLSASNTVSSTSGLLPANRQGGVNIMTASEDTLQYVGNMGRNIAAAIVAARSSQDIDSTRTCAWILEAGIVDAEEFKEIAPYLSTRSNIFRVRSVGYGSPGGRFCVLEAVIDISEASARVVYMRDITRLGMPLH